MTEHTFTLGDRLRKARKTSGLGSKDMAELLETSRTTISNYENGRTEPTATTVGRWAEITEADLVWLIVGDVVDLRSRCFSDARLDEPCSLDEWGIPLDTNRRFRDPAQASINELHVATLTALLCMSE